MRLGILVGLAAEGRIARRLGGLIEIGGGGRAGAQRACERLVASGADHLLSVGLAGGLDPALRAGTVLIPATVVTGGRLYPCDPILMAKLGTPGSEILCGGSAIVAEPAAKAGLRAATSAAAIDLESGAAALVAARHGLPFAVLRVICDPADRHLPPAALIALSDTGRIGLLRVAASILRHPGQLPELLALARDAGHARRALLSHVRGLGRLR